MADALSHQKDDVADIVDLHALVSRMRLVSSLDVVTAAEQIILGIIASYGEPNLALHEMHEYVRQGRMDYLVQFGEAARADLARRRAGSERTLGIRCRVFLPSVADLELGATRKRLAWPSAMETATLGKKTRQQMRISLPAFGGAPGTGAGHHGLQIVRDFAGHTHAFRAERRFGLFVAMMRDDLTLSTIGGNT